MALKGRNHGQEPQKIFSAVFYFPDAIDSVRFSLRNKPGFCAPKAMPVRYLGMSKNTSATQDTPRVPHAAQGVDVNFCRNPKCENFGVPIPQAARCNACGENVF